MCSACCSVQIICFRCPLQSTTNLNNKHHPTVWRTISRSIAASSSGLCIPLGSGWYQYGRRGVRTERQEMATQRKKIATVSHFASLDHDLHNQLVSTSAPKACWLHEILPPRSNAEAPLCGCKPSGEWSPCTCERKIPQGHTDDTVAWCWQCSLCSSRHVVAQINRLLVIRQQDSATHD